MAQIAGEDEIDKHFPWGRDLQRLAEMLYPPLICRPISAMAR
jgi:hypothetical protein